MEQPREGPKKLNVFAGIPVESRGVADHAVVVICPVRGVD
jgi:hypothetical protein